MPAEGEPLSKEQIALIKKWIAEGAVWLGTATPKESATAKPAGPAAPELPKDFKPSGAEQKAVAALAQKGIDLRPIAMNTPWRQANLRLLGMSVNDATLASLKDVASLVDLNLATTKITDKGLESLKGLKNLRRLHLELTAVTDAGLANLKPLANLTYLNLYGTNVTDAGLEHLKGLTYLRNLYVWQSKVTDAGRRHGRRKGRAPRRAPARRACREQQPGGQALLCRTEDAAGRAPRRSRRRAFSMPRPAGLRRRRRPAGHDCGRVAHERRMARAGGRPGPTSGFYALRRQYPGLRLWWATAMI